MAARPKLAETNRYDDSGAPVAPNGSASDPPFHSSQRLPSPLAPGGAANTSAPAPGDREAERSFSRAYQSGDVIALKYRLDRVLGSGGMGEVWVARNLDLDADVAIKLLRADASGDDGADRLLREARAAARLSDPAIVRVFDFGMSQFGDPYIAMELLEGEDLGKALARRGRFRPTKAVRVILPIIRALSAAHENSIVHRDLKPENIFLAKTAVGLVQPKLMDFGIAKLGMSRQLRLTHTGTMLGSPLYMSPEHARGDEVDFRADLWAICVVMYEIMTGNPPFVGKNYNAVIHSIIASSPPPMLDMGIGDEELWGILERGMSKLPEERWGSMSELGRALAQWLIKNDVHDDIVGASLQATWIDKIGTVHHDPLETIAPPAIDPLDSDVGELKALPAILPAGLVVSAPPSATPLSDEPPLRAANRPWLIAAVMIAVGIAIGFAILGRNDVSGTAAPRYPEQPPALPTVEPEAVPVSEHGGAANGAETEAPPAEESPQLTPSSAGSSTPLKNTRPRTTKKKLKNPFE